MGRSVPFDMEYYFLIRKVRVQMYLGTQHTLQLVQSFCFSWYRAGEGEKLAVTHQVVLSFSHFGKDGEEGRASINSRVGGQGGVPQHRLAERAQGEGGDLRGVPQGGDGGAGVAEALDNRIEGVKEMIFVEGLKQEGTKNFSLRLMTDQDNAISGSTTGVQP